MNVQTGEYLEISFESLKGSLFNRSKAEVQGRYFKTSVTELETFISTRKFSKRDKHSQLVSSLSGSWSKELKDT